MITTITQFNCGNAKPERTYDDLTTVKSDYMCLDETWDRKAVIKQWLKDNGFDEVPLADGWGDTPILFDPRKKHLLGFESHVVNPEPVYVGSAGNGPATIHPKFVVVGHFRDKDTGWRENTISTHVLASWTRHDLPPKEEKRRRELGEHHIEVLADVVRRLGNAYVCLDANAPKDFPGMKPLRDVIDLGNTGGIDHVGVKARNLTRVRRTEITNTSSDHPAIRARIVRG